MYGCGPLRADVSGQSPPKGPLASRLQCLFRQLSGEDGQLCLARSAAAPGVSYQRRCVSARRVCRCSRVLQHAAQLLLDARLNVKAGRAVPKNGGESWHESRCWSMLLWHNRASRLVSIARHEPRCCFVLQAVKFIWTASACCLNFLATPREAASRLASSRRCTFPTTSGRRLLR